MGAVLHGDPQLLPPPSHWAQGPPWPGAASPGPGPSPTGGHITRVTRGCLTAPWDQTSLPAPASRGVAGPHAGMLREPLPHPPHAGGVHPQSPSRSLPCPGAACPLSRHHSPAGRTHAGASFPWSLSPSSGSVPGLRHGDRGGGERTARGAPDLTASSPRVQRGRRSHGWGVPRGWVLRGAGGAAAEPETVSKERPAGRVL